MDLTGLINAIRDFASGVLRVNMTDAARASNHYAGFSGTFTGAGSLTIWAPSLGTRYKVKGISVVGIVDTLLAASNPITFFVADGTSGNIVAPITVAAASAAAGTLLPSTGVPVFVDLREGCIGSAAATTLVIKSSVSIGSGVVRFVGTAFGEEVVD